ncbi:MAG: SRPBCC family protein [Acidimicrobiales bacterium]
MSISTSIEVERPQAEVFAYVTDPSRFGEWQDGVVSGHMANYGPPSVGDLCVSTRRIGFAQRSVTSEVTHIEPPRTWGVRGIDGPIRAEVNVTVEALESEQRSRVTIEIDFSGHGIGHVLVPLLVQPQARKEMPANVKRLKGRLETGAERASGA